MISRPEKILIVEDDEVSRLLTSRILEASGFNIYNSFNGDEALVEAEKLLPDLILLDVSMPGISGFEVCKILKNKKETKDIPIIFLTGKTEYQDLVEGFLVGGVDYIKKPFNKFELLARVNTHLELKKSKDKIVEQNKIKDKFFSIIAHDLKSPLSSLTSLAEIMNEEFSDLSNDEIKKFIGLIYNSSRNVLSLIENLFTWSRSQIGTLEIVNEEIEIRHEIKRSIESLRSSARDKNIEIVFNNEHDLVILSDRKIFKLVIANLISNGIKFTNKDGLIEISFHQANGKVDINIKDNGIGFEKEDKEKLFKLESHFNTRGTNDEKGTGLGLILCKELLSKVGAQISFISEKDKGSCFTVSYLCNSNLSNELVNQ